MPIQRRYVQLPETSSVFGFGMLEMKPPKMEKYHRSLNYINSAGLLNANFLTVVWTVPAPVLALLLPRARDGVL